MDDASDRTVRDYFEGVVFAIRQSVRFCPVTRIWSSRHVSCPDRADAFVSGIACLSVLSTDLSTVSICAVGSLSMAESIP